ncbi:deoxyguanosinetriphosphate triphosphohydrolase [Arcanobacterium bovis]|uniref:Deoxyguanosinetriphosphate triphosphohydrolase-like protein n=1 Tax=Arcanobacterium bovis TaxID=2529275 RepID=A0A4Q9V2J1_9ACTO|nr:deoxyguanosinetriphosphate triphosphohydrolase [Arcanobacterium bovis]TBW22777.1 deoxyguanosinetriphosphate triphosphohydrolase [Arcanobacterium bovis]
MCVECHFEHKIAIVDTVQTQYESQDIERWVPEPPKNNTRTDFERDRARVLHSSALRRLGAKTQVLGPESDDFIRTRLTHSLEVAQVGRSLAKILGCDPDIVETACLCHDIGHPPFGHNGERALNELLSDIGGFEGNAQTLRVLSRLEPKRFHSDGRSAGLNLTRATVDATIKYPWAQGEGPASKANKFGAYDDDLDVFHWAHGEHGWERCVEAQIMDLSDDIAYSVHDLEDAVVHSTANTSRFVRRPLAMANMMAEREAIFESTMEWYRPSLSVDDLAQAFERITKMDSWPREFCGSLRDLAMLKDLTSDLIGRFVRDVAQATLAEHGTEPLLRYNAHVVVPEETKAEILLLKGIAVYYVMQPREHEPVYYEQRTVLFDLMDAISESPRERLESVFLGFWDSASTDAERRRVIADQIASLTDQSARQWHAQLCGMLRN